MGFFYGKNMLIKYLNSQLKAPAFESFDDFSQSLFIQDKQDSMAAVVFCGLRCTNLSQAFALAYRCALQALLPQLQQNQWAAMCVTEAQGNHPRHIHTQLDSGGRVSGEKRFITMAGLAKQLIVIAKQGDSNNRPILKAVLIKENKPQVEVTQMPTMGMLKDIPHGVLTLNQAQGEVLEGDGYEDYSKHFRLLEDAHMLMATSCLILNQAYRHDLTAVMQQALNLVTFMQAVDLTPSPWVHLQLASGFEQLLTLTNAFELEMPVCGEAFTQAWNQDKKLFSIASGARESRTKKAMQYIMAN